MKTCFSTLGCTGYTLNGVIAAALGHGIKNVEFRGMSGQLDNRSIPEFSPGWLSLTAEALRAAGLSAAVVGTSCSFHDPSKLPDTIDEGVYSASVAAALGCPYIRVFGNRIKGDPDAAIATVCDGISSLAGAIRGIGVGILLEVHGDFNTAKALRPVVSRLAGSGFGLIWDVAHTDAAYGDGWQAFCDEFMPYVYHVHLKDLHRRDGSLCLPGDGDLPLEDMLAYLSESGYGGCVSLEWEKKWHPGLPPLEEALEAFLRLPAGERGRE